MESNSFPAKVELHVHLDGAIRTQTLLDIAKRRNMKLEEKTVEELSKKVTITKAEGLGAMLDAFDYFLPIIRSDKLAIEQITKDFCEDSARQDVCYAEVRFAPHTLTDVETSSSLSPRDIVKIVLDTLKTSCEENNIKIKLILCVLRHKPEDANEILKMCDEFQNDGVVGMDVAGPEFLTDPIIKSAFEEAHRLGIHRTAHAGEVGTAENVKEAMDQMFAERIGHGYHVLDDDDLYNRLKKERIHLEICPISSLRTKAFTGSQIKDHPLTRFAEDNINFSLNTDDPSVFTTNLNKNYLLAQNMGLNRNQIVKSIFNAARSSFLPVNERNDLLSQLHHIYGDNY